MEVQWIKTLTLGCGPPKWPPVDVLIYLVLHSCLYKCVWMPSVVNLSQHCLHVYPGAHVLVAQEAGVSGQGIVGKNRVIVGGAGAGCVLA